MRRLDVMDFATPVTTVDALRTNLDTRIVITAEGKYEQLAYQSDNEFTIEINPAVEDPDAQSSLFSETKEYEGQRLTLNFQDIETRAVLQLLAETSGRNIVVSDTVQGNVTLRLRNVPWDQALDIVMTTKGLDMRQNGNVIIVAPAEENSCAGNCGPGSEAGDHRTRATLLRVPAGQLRQGGRSCEPDWRI